MSINTNYVIISEWMNDGDGDNYIIGFIYYTQTKARGAQLLQRLPPH